MPALTDHPSHTSIKIVIASDSGTGKTGGLASLVDAGYHLYILDFDRGVSTLRGYIKDKSKLANVHYIALGDQLKLVGKTLGIAKANAFKTAMDVLEKGSDDWGGENPGPLVDWPTNYILVIDTFSTMGRSVLAHVMQLDAKGMKAPEIQHYGIAMDNLEKFLGLITSESVRCSVIVNTHLQPIEGSAKIYPEALGSKLGPKVGRYFDNMITIGVKGGQKKYLTQKDGLFACKTAIPMDPEYPLETGLATIFKKLMEG